MAKKLKQSLVPKGMTFEKWAITASVADLSAEMQLQMNNLDKVLKGKTSGKKKSK